MHLNSFSFRKKKLTSGYLILVFPLIDQLCRSYGISQLAFQKREETQSQSSLAVTFGLSLGRATTDENYIVQSNNPTSNQEIRLAPDFFPFLKQRMKNIKAELENWQAVISASCANFLKAFCTLCCYCSIEEIVCAKILHFMHLLFKQVYELQIRHSFVSVLYTS